MSNSYVDHSAVTVFLKSWGLYQSIIRHNYMFHQEISAAVRGTLAGVGATKPLRVLDLGCGDGSMTLNLLPSSQIMSYIGCDLSKPALDIAQTEAASLGINANFVCEDMLNVAIEQPEASVDLVLSSYAIHHLNAQKKQQLLEAISRLLSSDGKFLLIDIFREPSEDRAGYMRHYMTYLRKNWVNLTPEDQEMVINHACEFDFPEHTDFYQLECDRQGLHQSTRLAKHTWHEAWMYAR